MNRMIKTLVVILCLLMGVPTGFAANQTVNVRAGIHDRYNRLVFDWKSKTGFSMKQDGNTVIIHFDKPATAQLRNVEAMKLPLIRNVSQQKAANGLSIRFQIPDQARIESFRTETGIAFDILHMDKSAPKFSKNTPAPAAVPETPSAPVVPEPEKEPIPPVAATTQPKMQTLADRLMEKPPEQELEGANKTDEAKQPAPPAVTQGTLIRLSPDEMTRLAAFIRAGKLWLVLDKPLERLTPTIDGENVAQLSTNARRISLQDGVAFVFDAPPPETVFAIRRQKNEWQIWLNSPENKYLPDDMAVNVKPLKDGDKNLAVSIYAGENPAVIAVKDTDLGDRLMVVPVRTPDGRISTGRNTPEYSLLPSLMGAVILPRSDALTVKSVENAVVIDATGHLQLSSQPDRDQGIHEAAFIPVFTLNIDKLPEGTTTIQRQALEKRFLQQKDAAGKLAALLDMVRLNIRHGFGPEATGLLRVAASIAPEVTKSREYQALDGMAAALSGDLVRAKAALADEALQSQPAAKLWLGYALATHYEWPQAHAAFAESGRVVETLPENLRPRFALARAETAMMIGDMVDTDQQLKKLDRKIRLSPSEKAAQDYIVANIDLMAGDKEDSLSSFDELSKGSDRLYKVKATMALTNRHLADKKITLDEAIKAFERLRFEWRNDRLEIDVLRRLGQLYIDNGQYMEGLSIWRQAAGLSKDTRDTDSITGAMQRVFTRLYVDGEADHLEPLKAVSLFESFRELTPAGQAGNIALAHLADRLAAVDLLDQADALLEKQLRQNATGEQAAALGTKLASWRLQNKNYSGALKALDESTQDASLPEAFSQKRLLLRAKALADLGRTNEALSLLNTLQSPESYSLKADINWRQNRWADAADAMQQLLYDYRDKGETAPTGPMPPLVLKMAIALTLDDNRKGIELLTAQYGDFMKDTPAAQAFGLITKPEGTGNLADMETLTAQVGEVELFQKFLKDFGK